MSIKNAHSGSSDYQTAWNKALEYLDKLPPERQKAFDGLSSEQQDLFRRTVGPAEITGLLKQAGSPKRSVLRLSKISSNFIQPFLQFSTSIDTVVQLNPGIGAPVWAPIKIILQVVMSVAEGFAQIEASLKDVLDKLPLFDEYEKYFRLSNPQSLSLVHDALAKFYVDVIDLTLVTASHYHRSVFRSILRSTVKDFGSDLGEVMLSMKGHVDVVNPAVVLGGIFEARIHHEDSAAGIRTLNIKTDQQIAKTDQQIANKLAEQQFSVKKWLSRTNVDANQQENQDRHLEGTNDWFFQSSDFHSWRDPTGSSRLWVRGIPGCGKSVLSSVLVEKLKQENEMVVYFFCKENDNDRNNPLSILRTFLWQFLHHPVHLIQSAIFDIVREAMLRCGTPSADSIRELWGPLQKIIDMLPAVYCVIDALDECDNKSGLADFLARLTNISSSTTTCKVFATCRLNEPHIETQLSADWSSVVIEKANIESDIGAFIRHRIEDSAALKSHKDKVYDSVYQGAGGMFLWARLMLDDLAGKSPWEVGKALEDMPEGLDDVYERLLKRPPKSSVERCRNILQWSVIARQPLSVDELAVALAVAEGLPSHEDYMSGLDRDFQIQRIRQDCGSLVTILEDETVQLVHTSLRTYLLESGDLSKPSNLNSRSSVFSINLDQAHMSLATACLQYNMFTCFQDDITELALESIKTLYPFSRYCTSNWIYHVTLSGSHYDDLSDMIIKFFDSKQGWQWLERCDIFDITDGHLLVLQGELKSWISAVGRGSQGEENGIGNFILHLSEKHYKESRRQGDEENIETIDVIYKMASFYYQQGRYSEALEWYGRALAGREKALGKEHPSTLDTVHSMAIVYDNQGQYSEALEWFGRALAGREKALGKEDPSTLITVNSMAIVYGNQGRYSEALEWFGRALAGKEKALGKEHPSTLSTVNGMAIIYRKQGQYSEALEWYGRALAGYEKALGKEHPSTLDTVNNMAIVYDNQGQCSEALEWYGRALAGREKALGEEHPSTLDTVYNMAIVYKNQGQYSEALEWYGRALAGYEKALGKEHPSTLDTVHNMAIVYDNQGQYSEALEWCGRALAGYEKALGKEHPSTLDAVHNMANAYGNQGQYSEALEWYERALVGYEKALGKKHPSTLKTIRNLEKLRMRIGISSD